jgi:hypothetical protein
VRLLGFAAAIALVTGVALLAWRAETPTREPEAPAPVGASAEPAAVPLDRLLDPPDLEPVADPLRGAPLGEAAGPEPAPGALDDLLEVEQRSSVSHRGTHADDTDVSVAVPVGESVRIRGGVRVQERDTGDEPQAETSPIVGVEVDY